MEGNFLVAEVLWQDHFGNLQLNISQEDIEDFNDNLVIHIGDKVRTVRKVKAFNQIQESEIGIISDSSGLLSLCAFGRSAAEEIRVSEGQQIKIENGSPLQETPTMITIKENHEKSNLNRCLYSPWNNPLCEFAAVVFLAR